MPLTSDQTSALTAFQNFLSSDNQVFMLKGSAGSGKTTLLKSFINEIGNMTCRLLAPTGRAAHILAEKTGRPASTIHRLIYQYDKISEDEDGKMYFCLNCNNDTTECIYFVDESSMVSDLFSDNEVIRFGSGVLLSDFFKYCGSRKIVFVGDYAQLPPVGQRFSPALDAEYLSKKYNVKCQEAFLRQVVRQAENSGIYKNATNIRDSIENDIYNKFVIDDSECVTSSDSLIDDYIRETGCKVDDTAIVVTYRNVDAVSYNNEIRRNLFANDQRLNPGDLLIISHNNYAYSTELFNGTIVKVVECDDDSRVEKRIVRFKTNKKDENGECVIAQVELAFRDVVIEINENGRTDTLKVKILDNFLTDKSPAMTKELAQALIVDFNNRVGAPKIISSDARRKLMASDKYFNALMCKYGYAITCHKAQGGEWKKVFVDMNRFGGTANNGYFRWAYTAITRSSEKLWHFASPRHTAISDMLIQPVTKGGNMAFYAPSDQDFREWRFSRIKELCDAEKISCVDDKSKQYQHIFMFSNDDKDSCKLQLWYNKSSYTGKIVVMTKTSDAFYEKVLQICEKSLLPDDFDFHPNSAFSSELYDFVETIAKELNVFIINVIKEQYKDVYYLKCDGYAVVSFSYNSKGIYTYMQPQSLNGTDALLNKFCEQFK